MDNVITNVNKRWESGLPHAKESVELYESLKKTDQENGNVLDFKDGGDGDNGEYLMFLLDIHFESKKQKKDG